MVKGGRQRDFTLAPALACDHCPGRIGHGSVCLLGVLAGAALHMEPRRLGLRVWCSGLPARGRPLLSPAGSLWSGVSEATCRRPYERRRQQLSEDIRRVFCLFCWENLSAAQRACSQPRRQPESAKNALRCMRIQRQTSRLIPIVGHGGGSEYSRTTFVRLFRVRFHETPISGAV